MFIHSGMNPNSHKGTSHDKIMNPACYPTFRLGRIQVNAGTQNRPIRRFAAFAFLPRCEQPMLHTPSFEELMPDGQHFWDSISPVLEWAQPAVVVGLFPQLGTGAVEGQDLLEVCVNGFDVAGDLVVKCHG
jgi:hypothetical protein